MPRGPWEGSTGTSGAAANCQERRQRCTLHGQTRRESSAASHGHPHVWTRPTHHTFPRNTAQSPRAVRPCTIRNQPRPFPPQHYLPAVPKEVVGRWPPRLPTVDRCALGPMVTGRAGGPPMGPTPPPGPLAKPPADDICSIWRSRAPTSLQRCSRCGGDTQHHTM
jgi:hypothetical protein